MFRKLLETHGGSICKSMLFTSCFRPVQFAMGEVTGAGQFSVVRQAAPNF